jgi:hypothetical protein
MPYCNSSVYGIYRMNMLLQQDYYLENAFIHTLILYKVALKMLHGFLFSSVIGVGHLTIHKNVRLCIF